MKRVLGPDPGPQSLTERLALRLQEQIATGALHVGARLPSERALAAQHRVSRATVVAALESLRSQGWVATRQGSGSYASAPVPATEQAAAWPPTAPRRGLDLASTDIAAPQPEYQHAAQRAAARIGAFLHLSGSPPQGLLELRNRIAERYSEAGTPTTPEQIVITRGAMAGLAKLLRVLHDRRRSVAVEEPTYPGAIQVLRRGRVRIRALPVDSREGWVDLSPLFKSDVDTALLTPETHNPTGAVMGDGQRQQILDLAARRDLTLVLDDTLFDFQWVGQPTTPLASASIVRIGSFAKSVWSGLAVGWIRGSGAVISLMEDRLDRLGVPSILEQLIAAEMLGQGMPHLARRRALLLSQRTALIEQLETSAHIRMHPSSGGLAVWCTLTDRGATAFCKAASNAGVEILGGSLFSVAAGQRHAFRVSFTQRPEMLVAGAKVLTELASVGSS